jgi:hypothetical protein
MVAIGDILNALPTADNNWHDTPYAATIAEVFNQIICVLLHQKLMYIPKKYNDALTILIDFRYFESQYNIDFSSTMKDIHPRADAMMAPTKRILSTFNDIGLTFSDENMMYINDKLRQLLDKEIKYNSEKKLNIGFNIKPTIKSKKLKIRFNSGIKIKN